MIFWHQSSRSGNTGLQGWTDVWQLNKSLHAIWDWTHRPYSVLEGFSDGCYFPNMFFGELRALQSFPFGTLAKLYTFMYYSLVGSRAMRHHDCRDLWSPISQRWEENIDKLNRYKGAARYSSTKKTLLNSMENNGGQVRARTRRASLDVRLRWLAGLLSLEKGWEQ